MRVKWIGALVMVLLAGLSAGVRADVCQSCDGEQVDDPKMHGRSLKSYWGVAHATKPPDPEVLAKAFEQGHLALCGTPDQWEWNMFMGMLAAEMEKFDESGCYFMEAVKYSEGKDREKVLNNRGSFWVQHYNQSLDYFKKEAYEPAIDEANIAIQIAPDSCKAHNVKGSALSKMGRPAEAIPVLQAGLKVCPDHEGLRTNLLSSYMEQGDALYKEGAKVSEDTARTRLLSSAIVWYEEAEKVDSSNPNLQYQIGSSYAMMAFAGDSTAIDPAREALLKFTPTAESKQDRLAVYYQLCMLEIQAKDFAKATEYCDLYIAADPHDADGYRLKASILRQSGDNTSAESWIILYNSLAKGSEQDAESLKADPKYASGDLPKMITEKGPPEEYRSYTDSSGNNMDAAFYWSKGLGVAFYGGQKRGEVTIPAASK